MSYFTALMFRSAGRWTVEEVDLDEVETLDDLADLMRESADEDPVLLLVEQEGAWFGILRIDADDEPRAVVSDGLAASRSAYGEMLLEAAEVDSHSRGPVGDAELLDDLGVDREQLLELCARGTEPGEALNALAATLDAEDQLEAVR
ncbi:MAG TPA: hypothetical protein VIL00_14260 [Pseudonocardiaceae bacterium]